MPYFDASADPPANVATAHALLWACGHPQALHAIADAMESGGPGTH